MRKYETIVISDPDLSDEDRTPLFNRMTELIPQEGGFLIEFDEWGTQKLAYEIRKKKRAHYVRLDYCGSGALVAEMERQFRIDDRVLKYMTVLIDKQADVEKIKMEMAEATKETETPEAETPKTEVPETEAANTETETAPLAETPEKEETKEPETVEEES